MKKETLISVRLPSSLVMELKKITQHDHYLDLSETVRSIVRSRCLDYLNPYQAEMKKFRKELSKDLLGKARSKQELLKDLKRITEELTHE